MDNAG